MSIFLLTCQSGKIDKYILGISVNDARNPEVTCPSKQDSQKEIISYDIDKVSK
jgi:hypothetical protein